MSGRYLLAPAGKVRCLVLQRATGGNDGNKLMRRSHPVEGSTGQALHALGRMIGLPRACPVKFPPIFDLA